MAINEQDFSGENKLDQKLSQADLRRENAQLKDQVDSLVAANRELTNKEALLRLSVETGKVGVWVWDTEGSVHSLGWSDRLKEIFGLLKEGDVTRELFLKCVHPEDRERIDWAIMQALAGVNQGFYNVEYRITHPVDSSVHWVTAQGQAFFNSCGQSIRFIGAVVDISDRKQAEEFTARLNLELEGRVSERVRDLEKINKTLETEVQERTRLEEQLRESQAFLADAQELAQMGSFSLTLPEGKLTWSDETARICEYEVGTVPALELALNRVHPDDIPRLQAIQDKAFRERSRMDFEFCLLMADKSIKWVRVVARPLLSVGESVTFVGAVIDITKRKKDEETLRASEQFARGQLDTLKEILGAISKEQNPNNLLQHVLCAIARQMGGQSVSVFSRNEDDSLSLEVVYDNGQMDVPRENIKFPVDDQPFFAECMASGKECLMTELDRDPNWFRFVNRPNHAGVPRFNEKTPPFIVDVHMRLKAQGVILSLMIPMVTSGRVSGMIGIRYHRRREFSPEEIDLSLALAQQAALAMQVVRLSRESRQTAIASERNRMARDIHDTLAQGFTGIIAQLQAAKGAFDLKEAASHIEKAENLARSSLDEARRSVRAMRPRSLDATSLVNALEGALRTTANYSGLSADFYVKGEERPLSPEREEALLRIAQESLINTIKHAKARHFSTRLIFEADKLQLKLADDGCGFDLAVEREGFGLVGMKERVDQMDGEFSIHSQPGCGTEIVITIPCVLKPEAPLP